MKPKVEGATRSARHSVPDVNEQACHTAATVVGFGAAAWIAFTVIASVALDMFAIDLVPIILLSLVPAMRRGSALAATWGCVILALYGVTAISMLLGIWISTKQVHIGSIAIEGAYRWVATCILFLLCIWSAVGGWLSWRSRRAAQRIQRYLERCCVQCGYDLQGTEAGRCPECGQPIDVAAHE